ncbi:hypothetical protein BGZ94_001836, partial [Podila epigama]
LGIYDEFISLAKHHTKVQLFNQNLESEYAVDVDVVENALNHGEYVISRQELYALLLRQLPKENVHFNKKFASYTQTDEFVEIRFADGSTLIGDLLVGSDGANSAVRKQLFKNLKASGKLPPSDEQSVPYGSITYTGETEVLRAEEFPDLQSDNSQFYSVINTEKSRTWLTCTTKQNTVCWMAVEFVDKIDKSIQNPEWSPVDASEISDEIRAYKVPGGKDGKQLTLGDYIDRTPAGHVGKTVLTEKVFDSWHSARVVLLADAAHKLNPAGTSGALNAMHDAAVLANWIGTIQLPIYGDLYNLLKEYQTERHPAAKWALDISQLFAKSLGAGIKQKDPSIVTSVVRGVLKRLPTWVMRRAVVYNSGVRPQVSFLPLIDEEVNGSAAYQASLHKTLAILKEQERVNSIRVPLSVAVSHM